MRKALQKSVWCILVGVFFFLNRPGFCRWLANGPNAAIVSGTPSKASDSSNWKLRPRLMGGAIYLPKFDYPYSIWYAFSSVNLRSSKVTTWEQTRGLHCSLFLEVGLLHLGALYAKFGPEWRIGPSFYFDISLGGITGVSIIEENRFTLPLAGAAVGHGIRLSKKVRLEVEMGALFVFPYILAGVSFP